MKSILTNTLSNQTDKPEESQFNENSTNQRGVKLENIENNRKAKALIRRAKLRHRRFSPFFCHQNKFQSRTIFRFLFLLV